MADTYGDLLDAIAEETRRPRASFGTRIEKCVKEAIVQSEAETYWFNDAAALTFNTVASQENYGSSDLSTIPFLTEIQNISVDSGNVENLRKASWDALQGMNPDGNSFGQPTHYAFAFKKIRLYPIPTDAWPVTISGAYSLTELSADADTNCWTTRREGEPLIRARASAIFYATHLRLPDRAAVFDNLAKSEVLRLTASTSRRQATGRIRRSL